MIFFYYHFLMIFLNNPMIVKKKCCETDGQTDGRDLTKKVCSALKYKEHCNYQLYYSYTCILRITLNIYNLGIATK